MNAELWSRTSKFEVRLTLEDFLERNNISYSQDMKNEELRQLYVDYECGNL